MLLDDDGGICGSFGECIFVRHFKLTSENPLSDRSILLLSLKNCYPAAFLQISLGVTMVFLVRTHNFKILELSGEARKPFIELRVLGVEDQHAQPSQDRLFWNSTSIQYQ